MKSGSVLGSLVLVALIAISAAIPQSQSPQGCPPRCISIKNGCRCDNVRGLRGLRGQPVNYVSTTADDQASGCHWPCKEKFGRCQCPHSDTTSADAQTLTTADAQILTATDSATNQASGCHWPCKEKFGRCQCPHSDTTTNDAQTVTTADSATTKASDSNTRVLSSSDNDNDQSNCDLTSSDNDNDQQNC